MRRIRQGAAAARGQQQQRQQLQPQPARVLGSSQQQQEPKQQQQQLPPWLLQQQAESAASGGRVKQYKPVPKGDLLLPGGPAWSGLRRHVVAAGADPSLPTLDCIVIVEGDNDQKAVCRAVNATVSREERDSSQLGKGVDVAGGEVVGITPCWGASSYSCPGASEQAVPAGLPACSLVQPGASALKLCRSHADTLWLAPRGAHVLCLQHSCGCAC